MDNRSDDSEEYKVFSQYISVKQLTSSIILETMMKAAQTDCCNLAQGFLSTRPNLDACSLAIAALLGGTPAEAEKLQKSLLGNKPFQEAIADIPMPACDILNQYTAPWGMPELRKCISEYYKRVYGCNVDPNKNIIVTLGSLEAMSVVMRALVPPDYGVIIFQPYHELYINQARIFYIIPIVFPMTCSSMELENNSTAKLVWTIDFEALEELMERSLTPIAAMILNSPHNPTGKVFTREEISKLYMLCVKYNIFLIKDDVYEHITFTDNPKELKKHPHQIMLPSSDEDCSEDDRIERLITVSSISKVGRATGWRIGWIITPSSLISRLTCVHDNLALQAPTVFQFAAQAILTRPLEFYFYEIAEEFKNKCNIVAQGLKKAEFQFARPEGSYYIFALYDKVPVIGEMDPKSASFYLMENAGLASVAGGAFLDYSIWPESFPIKFLRFACCKPDEVLQNAMDKLVMWYESVKSK